MLESRSCESQDSLSEKLQDADDVKDKREKRAYEKEDSKEHEDLAGCGKRLVFEASPRRVSSFAFSRCDEKSLEVDGCCKDAKSHIAV